MISIIVPVYNVQDFLLECVQSITNQTYKDIEIVLVDDGSTDESGQMCDDLSQKDCRIKVIHKKNGGLSSARNLGIDNSTGDYIMFVDSDDFLAPDYCESHINQMSANVMIVMSDFYKYKNGAVTIYATKWGTEHVRQVCGTTFIKHALMKKISNSACGKLFKRNIFDKVHFREGFKNEDTILFFDLAECIGHNNCVITHIPYRGYYYRERENSLTTSIDDPLYLSVLNNIDMMEKECTDDSLKTLLHSLYSVNVFDFCESLIRDRRMRDSGCYDKYWPTFYAICKSIPILQIWEGTESIRQVFKFVLMTRAFYVYKKLFVK